MKKYIVSVILACLISSCTDVLDKGPLDAYSDASVWSDVNLANYYLNYCYKNSLGFKSLMTSAVCDEVMFHLIKGTDTYLLGNISADDAGPWAETGGYSFDNYSWSCYSVVQRVNVFIANIDNVPEAYSGSRKEEIKKQTNRMKGEALFLRAFLYSKMCLTYGGLPIIKKPNELGDDFSSVIRASFEETVNFIVEDCDAAANLLKLKSETELGRATKEAALALKSRILLFAASDLTADGTAENNLVGYNNPNRTALWTAAKNAAKAVMDIGTCKLADLGAPDKIAVAKNYFEFFKAYDLSNAEIIWGKMFLQSNGDKNQMNLRNANNGNECYGSHSPSQNLVDEYEMEDGSKFFNHFELINNYYKNKSTTFKHENPYYNREPRFYASILYDSVVWQPRIYASLAQRDPVGIYDRRTRRTIANDGTITDVFGLDTRQGPVDKEDGTYTGYIMKKMLDDKIVGYYNANLNVIIELRYAEVIMNYAEACLGLGDTETAAKYINMIRSRAGLPDFKGDITTALRHEREIEFAFENKRWFDIRRWKILEKTLTDALGMDVLETTQGGKVTTTWRQIIAQTRGPVSKKMYWIPITTTEINKAPQLKQNPGY